MVLHLRQLLGPGGAETVVIFRAILEHKRKMDRQTAWQSTRYQIRTIEWHRSQPGGQDSWPIVITIVIYHGDVPWTAPRELRELFDVPMWLPKKTRTAIRNLLPSGRYVLEVPYSDPRELLGDVLRHGSSVEVLEPPEMRAMLRAELQAALDVNAG